MSLRSLTGRLSAAAVLAGAAILAMPALAQDTPPQPEPGTAPETTVETTEPEPSPVSFGTDLDAAVAQAKSLDKPLLVLVVPGWYDSPETARLDEQVLTGDDAREQLEPFIRVRVTESEDYEVHVRHRLPRRGYPLAVVLSARGLYLGSHAGLATDDATKTWPAAVAAIPGRHARIQEFLGALKTTPEDPSTLFALARLRLDAGEPDRADALLSRYETADRSDSVGKLGEARYLRLTIANVTALEARKFGDVESLCLKWRRRFSDHPRLPDVLLLQANARFLNGKADEARKLWTRITEDAPDSPAAKRATAALETFTSDD